MHTNTRQALEAFQFLAARLGPQRLEAQADGYRESTDGDPADDPKDGSRWVATSVTGPVHVDHDVEAAASQAPLSGIIWGAGDHNLSLGGTPTAVRVPPESIAPTFEALRDAVAAGDVTLGFDHPAPDSVAAQTGIVDIGTADGVALSADGQFIVLTDSTLTNDQAQAAADDGRFDGLDWSVVADVAVRRDDAGDPVVEDGRVVIDATRIRRIDAVDTGAVDAASIVRDHAALPDLADQSAVVRQVAASTDPDFPEAAVALRASAAALSDHMTQTFDPDVDDDVPDAVREQLEAAASIIDDQTERLEAAEAKADGFITLLTAHGLDADDFDTPADAAQAIIDEQTTDIREDIARLEASLATYDTTDDTVDDRVDDLAGTSPDDLRNLLNARKADAYDRDQKAASKGRAITAGDTQGRTSPIGGDGAGGSADADDVALGAMDGEDRIQAAATGQSPAEYVKARYGLEASAYDASDSLHNDIRAALRGDEGGD